MKRALSLILAALMVGTVVLTFTACNGDSGEGTSSGGGKGVVRRYKWSGEDNETEAEQRADFESETGIKIEDVVVAWENMDLQFVLDMAGGTPVDIVYMQTQKWPKYAIQGIAKPMEDYLPSDHRFWKKNGLEFFTIGGKHYGALPSVDPLLLWYNKTMFEENDVKTPLEEWEDGNWTWETFAKAAKELTVVGADGTTQVWGFSTWRHDAVLSSNNARFVNYNPDGTITPALSEPATMNALQFMQDACYTDKWMDPVGNYTWCPDFRASRVAMTVESSFVAWNGDLTDLPFEIDFAPMPVGPDNTEGVHAASLSASGVCAAAKNVENAVAYLEFLDEWGQREENKSKGMQAKTFTAEQQERWETIRDGQLEGNLFMGIGNLQDGQFGLWNAILSEGTPVATAVAEQEPNWVLEIENALAESEMPEVKPFTAVPKADFEDGIPDTIKTYAGVEEMGILSAEVVDDGIDGKSLKVVCDPDYESCALVATDPAKVTIPGWHKYKVSIDYKIVEDVMEGGYLALCLRPADDPTGGQNIGWVEVTEGLTAGSSGTITGEFTPIEEVENLAVVFVSIGGGTLLIDNVSIVDANA